MVAEIHADNVFSTSTAQTRAPEKVQPVNPAKPLQKLPGEGKELPRENREAPDLDDIVQMQHRDRCVLLPMDAGSGYRKGRVKSDGTVLESVSWSFMHNL